MSVEATIPDAVIPAQARNQFDAPSRRHSRESGNPKSFARYPKYKDSGVEWLGQVPAHWMLPKIKHIATFCGGGTPSRETAAYWNGDIPWVSPKDMKSERIIGAEESITAEGLANSSSSLIATGATLLVVRSGILKHTIPVAINDVPVALNQDMRAVRFAAGSCLNDFFLRWVQGLNNELLLAWAKQGATVESIEHDYFAESTLPLPPVREQIAIAAFLDRETSKIDALVAEQEKLIALLKEKRQALISHAVTKGLDPNASMKDSSIEWLGDVPAHWHLVPLGYIVKSRCDGPFGSGLKSEHYVDAGARVIRLQNIRDGRFSAEDEAYIDLNYFQSELAGHDVLPNDLLVAGLGDDNNPVGRACVAPANLGPALVKADCFRFRLDEGLAQPEFVALQLSAGAAPAAGKLSTGTTRQRIPLSATATRRVALPPLREQSEVVLVSAHEAGRIDALIAEALHAIALLKERRAALISAAVTGKIDVRGAVAIEQQAGA